MSGGIIAQVATLKQIVGSVPANGHIFDIGSVQMSALFSSNWSSGGEASAQCIIPIAGTFKNASLNINVNGSSVSVTATVRKNGSAGNQTVTIGAGSTGKFSDSTHTDAVVANDLIALSFSQSATSFVAGTFTMEFDPS